MITEQYVQLSMLANGCRELDQEVYHAHIYGVKGILYVP
jgi:hypothetical protein